MFSFLGGIVGGFFWKMVSWLALWFGAKHAGEIEQRGKDLEATQNAEQTAADARNRADTNPDYAGQIREKYTDRSDT
jgi:hypothetical protein